MPLSPHFHDEYLICAQLSGEEECQVSGKTQRFSAGDVVLINPQQVHTGNQTGNHQLEYVSLYVDRELVQRLANEWGAATSSPEFTVIKAGSQPELVARLVDLLGLVRDGVRDGEAPNELSLDLSLDGALAQVVMLAFEEFSTLRLPMLRSTNRVGHRKIARSIEH